MAMGAGAMDHGMGHGMGHEMGMMNAPPPSPSSMPMPMHMHKMMMHMTFFWGRRVDVLFSGWPGDRGLGTYLLALLLVFILALLVEFLSFIPVRLDRGGGGGKRISSGLMLTGITAVRTGLSYMVMLAVMSFNAGVLLVAVAGHAVGFFVFGTGIIFGRRGDGGHQGIGNKC